MKLLLYAILLLSLGCSYTISASALDVFNRSISCRTIILEERYSLYLPFPASGGEPWQVAVEEDVDLVSHLFGYEFPDPIVVMVEYRQVEGREHLPAQVLPGMQGFSHSNSTNAITVFLPTGYSLQGGIEVDPPLRNTLRHELAHLFYNQLGFPRDSWLFEGVPTEVSHWRKTEFGGVEPQEFPDRLIRAAFAPDLYLDLEALLSWEEEFDEYTMEGLDVNRGARMRLLAYSFIRFSCKGIRGWISLTESGH